MELKSEMLMKLEELSIFWQDKKTGGWYTGFKEDYDMTPEFKKAGLIYYEH